MDDCPHASGHIAINAFPLSIVGECDACGCRTMYTNLKMVDYADRIVIYFTSDDTLTLRKDVPAE